MPPMFTYVMALVLRLEDVAWMPVSHKFDVGGKILGFRFKYDYLASVSDYRIHLNPDLEGTPEVIDEKIEKEYADSIASLDIEPDLLQSLEEGKEITSKQLKKAMKEYEKSKISEFSKQSYSSDDYKQKEEPGQHANSQNQKKSG